MDYKITIDEKRALIMVKYSGAITLEDRAQAVKEGARNLNSTGYRKVLVDLSDAKAIFQSPEDESDFANVLSNNKVLRHCKTAYLAKSTQHSNDFVEILARARHYNFKHFTDINEAYQWLTQD